MITSPEITDTAVWLVTPAPRHTGCEVERWPRLFLNKLVTAAESVGVRAVMMSCESNE